LDPTYNLAHTGSTHRAMWVIQVIMLRLSISLLQPGKTDMQEKEAVVIISGRRVSVQVTPMLTTHRDMLVCLAMALSGMDSDHANKFRFGHP